MSKPVQDKAVCARMLELSVLTVTIFRLSFVIFQGCKVCQDKLGTLSWGPAGQVEAKLVDGSGRGKGLEGAAGY